MNNVHFLVVAFGDSESSICSLIDSLKRQTSNYWKLTILANGKEAINSLQNLEKDYRVDILETEKNLGYFPGLAHSASKVANFPNSASWWVVCNHDVVFSDDFVEALHDIVELDSILAPSILTMGSSRNQNPFLGEQPSRNSMLIKYIVLRIAALYWIAEVIYNLKSKVVSNSYSKSSWEFQGPCQIFAPHGSVIIFGFKVLRDGLDLGKAQFLYGEEYFVAGEAIRMKKKIWYYPTLKVWHHCGRATSKIGRRNRRKFQLEAHRKFLLPLLLRDSRE